jgi:2,3-bisphosphoglycerate-independent phosphoglycerate mutase
MTEIKPVILLILDGWGYAPNWGGNAVTQAKTRFFDTLWRDYPHTTLGASGQFVGLPGHEQGNSEVGHLNIGSGRVVYQDITRINESIEDKSFFTKRALIDAIEHCKKYNSKLHLMGLLSDGGVHSHIDHLFSLIDFVKMNNFDKLCLQIFTDGRDTPPMNGLQFISRLEQKIKQVGIGRICSISGRYWAMDRDKHWDRISQVYNTLTIGSGPRYDSTVLAMSTNYKNGNTDEFILPTIISEENKISENLIDDNDAIIFFNFRSDRAREITQSLCDPNFIEFKREKTIKNLFFVTIIPYGIERELDLEIHAAFDTDNLSNTLAEVLSDNNLKQFHISETEKYAHVTYFFNGGRETPFPGEERMVIQSPKVATFDLKPEMSINELTKNVLNHLKNNKTTFTVINFANPDMVGHTGNLRAAIDACEITDEYLGKIYEFALKNNYVLLVTADHGNVEEMIDPRTGEVDTEHSCNPVPFILANGPKVKVLKPNGVLADIAPTILKLIGVQKPKEMTGEPLYSI